MTKITIEGENLKVSDGYHTIDELYEHRIILYIALCRKLNVDYPLWVSTKHSDESSFGDWFIMGITLPDKKQISYHLPARFWGECCAIASVLDKAPEWDGHTSQDVLKRLLML